MGIKPLCKLGHMQTFFRNFSVEATSGFINKNKVKMELPDNFKQNETLISDPVEISNKFNEYFINVGPKLADRIQNNNVNFATFLGEISVNSIFLDAVTEK